MDKGDGLSCIHFNWFYIKNSDKGDHLVYPFFERESIEMDIGDHLVYPFFDIESIKMDIGDGLLYICFFVVFDPMKIGKEEISLPANIGNKKICFFFFKSEMSFDWTWNKVETPRVIHCIWKLRPWETRSPPHCAMLFIVEKASVGVFAKSISLLFWEIKTCPWFPRGANLCKKYVSKHPCSWLVGGKKSEILLCWIAR